MERPETMKAAYGALANAWAPYSAHKVGAAIETKTGKIFAGCNVENASYGLTVCAERAAACAAVAAGETAFLRIVIVTSSGKPTSPCGACRQFLSEFAPNMEVVMIGRKGVRRQELSALLPVPFEGRKKD